jgi:hypothetical protein
VVFCAPDHSIPNENLIGINDEYYDRRIKEETEKGVRQLFNNLFNMRMYNDYKSYNFWKPNYDKWIIEFHPEYLTWWNENIKLNNLPLWLNQDYP